MPQMKVLVAPLLEARIIDRRRMPGAGRLPGAVKMDDIFAERVIGRQIGAAAEPALVSLGQKAEIGMDGRHERIAWMQNQRDAYGSEIPALAGNLSGEFLGELAMNIG